MTEVTLYLDNTAAQFYCRLAQAIGKTAEQVMADALFKLAGELSLEALRKGREL
ncbi:MAG: hypothetical protein IJN53_01035 [Oscillospiraceae bacterium]|nr:hypothetical protein [Oscillospiraceae bacterium]